LERMKIQEARELGDRIAVLVAGGQYPEAHGLLSPLLADRTPFRLLDAVAGRFVPAGDSGAPFGTGTHISSEPPQAVNSFLDRVAAQRTMGGWVIIASALRQQIAGDLPGAFERCRGYVEAAGVWHAADTFSERVPGPALLGQFEPALALLGSWREAPNRWTRRMVGVAVHFWAKHAHGDGKYLPQADALLDLLEPVFGERDRDAAKGVGWGLKTLGKYYPALLSEWLALQASQPHLAVTMRKAVTYLPADLRRQFEKRAP